MKVDTKTLIDLTKEESELITTIKNYENNYMDWTIEEIASWNNKTKDEIIKIIEEIKDKVPNLIQPNRKRECKVTHNKEIAWRLKWAIQKNIKS